MGECKLDHSKEDVIKKLADQSFFLPADIYEGLASFLEKEPPQTLLNEAFHLLKKYDLASQEERENRHKKMTALSQL